MKISDKQKRQINRAFNNYKNDRLCNREYAAGFMRGIVLMMSILNIDVEILEEKEDSE